MVDNEKHGFGIGTLLLIVSLPFAVMAYMYVGGLVLDTFYSALDFTPDYRTAIVEGNVIDGLVSYGTTIALPPTGFVGLLLVAIIGIWFLRDKENAD